MHFQRFDSGFERYRSIVKLSLMELASQELLDDRDAKILAILNKSLFESARSIAETLRVADSTVLLHVHDSIGFRSFYLHWLPHLLTYDFREKERNIQKQCSHSCVLPNEIDGITS
jgi:hypothetical protein